MMLSQRGGTVGAAAGIAPGTVAALEVGTEVTVLPEVAGSDETGRDETVTEAFGTTVTGGAIPRNGASAGTPASL